MGNFVRLSNCISSQYQSLHRLLKTKFMMTTTELPLSRCSIEWICKHSRSPYLAKKYGHLLSSADEDVICQDQKAFVDRSSLNPECDSPTFFSPKKTVC